jgi:hypothetical protein
MVPVFAGAAGCRTVFNARELRRQAGIPDARRRM